MSDFIDDLRAIVRDAASAEGLDAACGHRLALAVSLAVQREHGATRPYVRSARCYRDAEIVRAVKDGAPLERAARQAGVSVRTVRRALRRSLGPPEWEL